MSSEPCMCGDRECKRCYPFSYRMAEEEEPDDYRWRNYEDIEIEGPVEADIDDSD